MNNNIEKAKSLLVHYFDLAGCVRDSDNRSEIEDIVDLIVEGLIDIIKEAK